MGGGGVGARQRLGLFLLVAAVAASPLASACSVSPWSAWGACSSGTRIRTRKLWNNYACTSAQLVTQQTQECRNCELSEFGPWSNCSGGVQQRERKILVEPVNSEPCGDLVDKKECHPCVVTAWGQWSKCSYAGTQERHRTVQTEGDQPCPSLEEQRACPAPVDCVLSDFGAWGACVNNVRTREQRVAVEAANGGAACNMTNAKETEKCAACRYSPYGNWSECENGTETRTRSVLAEGYNGGTPCDESTLFEKRTCCVLSAWTNWTSCLHNRTQRRERHIIQQGHDCAEFNLTEEAPCVQPEEDVVPVYDDEGRPAEPLPQMVYDNDEEEEEKEEKGPCCEKDMGKPSLPTLQVGKNLGQSLRVLQNKLKTQLKRQQSVMSKELGGVLPPPQDAQKEEKDDDVIVPLAYLPKVMDDVKRHLMAFVRTQQHAHA